MAGRPSGSPDGGGEESRVVTGLGGVQQGLLGVSIHVADSRFDGGSVEK